MNRLQKTLTMICAAAALCGMTGTVQAQERQRGNFDPEQMRQRMMERYREQLGVTGDDEWKAIEPRIAKVTEARREIGIGGGFGRGPGGPGGGRRGGDNDAGGDGARRRGPGGEPNPDAEALQKAIEAKASNEELKAKLAKYREARKAKEANLAKAQEDLRAVLSVRQEASAVLMGLLQ
jgi:hypothetical protein